MPRISQTQEAKNARNLGVSIEEYRAQRERVRTDKARGKGIKRANPLEDWGQVDGQFKLFETD